MDSERLARLSNDYYNAIVQAAKEEGLDDIQAAVQEFGTTGALAIIAISNKFAGQHPFDRNRRIRDWLRRMPNYADFDVATITALTEDEVNRTTDVSAVSGTIIPFE